MELLSAFSDVPGIIAALIVSVDMGLITLETRSRRVVAVFIVALVVALDVGWSVFSADAILREYAYFAAMLPFLLMTLAFRRSDLPRYLFALCLFVTLCHLMMMLPLYFYAVFGLSGPYMLFVGLVAAIVGVAIEHALVGKRFAEMQDDVKEGWNSTCICATIGTVIMLVPVCFVNAENLVYILMMDAFTIFLMLLMFASILMFYFQVRQQMVRSHELEIFRLQREQQEKADLRYREQEAAERKRRHDERHMLQVIIDELQEGKTNDAVAHLMAIRGDIPTPKMQYCRHNGVNSMLSLWSQRAEQEGIEVTIRADVPEKLEIDSMELSTMFGNLMENAFEGCMRLERKEARRYIDLRVTYKAGKLICQEENSCRKDVVVVEGMPITQKHHGGGIGTHSIRDTVTKYGGMISFEAEDGIFTVRFMMAV